MACCSGTPPRASGAPVQSETGEPDAGRGFNGNPGMSGERSAGASRALVQGGPTAQRVAEGRDEEAGRTSEADTVRHQGARLRTIHVHRAESPRRKLHVG